MIDVMQTYRLLIILLWIGALVGYYFSVKAYPPKERRERMFYSSIMLTYIIHVVIFYTYVFVVRGYFHDFWLEYELIHRYWLQTTFIHGGVSIVAKEVVAIYRRKAGA